MTLVGKTSHALFFNGVSDSVVCPQAEFAQTGIQVAVGSDTARSSRPLTGPRDEDSGDDSDAGQVLKGFTVEAWVIPDCGGVVAVKDDLFELRIGSVHEPAPASFSVHLRDDEGIVTVAKAMSAEAKSGGGYNGIIFPRDSPSFLAKNSDIDQNARGLLHVAGIFNGNRVSLYINGDLVASEKLNADSHAKMTSSDLYIGGRGGQYRGRIEGVHWTRDINESGLEPTPLVKGFNTLGLWRFEEPVEVDSDIIYITSNLSAGATSVVVNNTQVQTLYRAISGKSDTFSGTYTVPSLGDYQVAVSTHSGGAQKVAIPHTSFNLLINPTCTDVKTGKANNKPPERVRIKSLASSGTITVESVHLDFDNDSNTGARGVLHARTALDASNNLANDSAMVLIRSDLLIDSGTGQPLQPPGLGSQAIDRNGGTIIDESDNRNHGYLFSRRVSVGNSDNPYSVSSSNWSIDDKFQSGHSGRHVYSHVTGHPYLQHFPVANEEKVIRTMDGLADSIEVHFDGRSSGIKEQVPINSEVSLYKKAFTGRAVTVKNTSTAKQVIRNGLSTLDPQRDGIIAIGGADFDFRPFLLKGHAYEGVTSSDGVYDLHLTPETENRVAVLETGDSDIPYVEIHYNAIDLTGDTIGTSGPALLVEKTVPAGGSVINSKRVAATIATSISSGMTLHSPGGLIRVDNAEIGGAHEALQPHKLVGDNTGGKQYELELDLSGIPSNYTPKTSSDDPQTPPRGIESSHAEDSTHPSVYHKLVMRPSNKAKSNADALSDDHYRRAPTTTGGNIGSTTQSSNIFESFDIIDNYPEGDQHVFVVQPTNRSRVLQLSNFVTNRESDDDPSFFSLEFLLSRGRVNNIEAVRTGQGRRVTLTARGLMDDIAMLESDYSAEGSPDSHIVKEIKPGAPVVTVTLGGPGQGAIDTKPTWDPSPLSRLGWSTRKDCAVTLTQSDTSSGTLTVAALNNESDALASWGTYCFPSRGRVHLQSGAHAEYYSTSATQFFFWSTTGHLGTGRFINVDGTESDSFSAWVGVADNKVVDSSLVLLDPLFDESAVCADGTTINDRLFQSIGSVTHDYQLGTQYASTRALVEIPLFPNQFFDNSEAGVFPGPDNSMKLHVDTTLTAHSWAPNPVGRRCPDVSPADREVMAAYHRRWVDDEDRHALRITRIEYPDIYVENISRMPDSTTTYSGTSKSYPSVFRARRVFRPSGAWAIVSAMDRANNKLTISTIGDNNNGASKGFLDDLKVGTVLTLSGGYQNDSLAPIRDDPFSTTAAREFRRAYYHDRSNVQTQGGNIDYGLRQYVSAVEFKAGPRSNPHLPRIKSGGAGITLLRHLGSDVYVFDGDDIPPGTLPTNYAFEAIHENGSTYQVTYDAYSNDNRVTVVAHPIFDAGAASLNSTLGTLTLKAISATVANVYPLRIVDGTVNKTWNHPYCPGGLRYGDTVWMNMHYTNPHAVEGLFCKSRGVYNEFEVWNGFNGGRGELGSEARASIALENFLIGDTCAETAANFVQHVNKTVELNWVELGFTASTAPVVAYLDPYQCVDGEARVLLYDVAHDREFIAFHDLHMQVQSSPMTPTVEGLDVASGFRTQRKDRNPTVPSSTVMNDNGRSKFIEGAYTHKAWYLMDPTHGTTSLTLTNLDYADRQLPHYVGIGNADCPTGSVGRLEDSVCCPSKGVNRHSENITGGNASSESTKVQTGASDRYRFNSTFFDTPDGTRAIPAYLCLKGIRSGTLDLSSHSESRLQNLPQWTQMDFVRRLSVDLGEVGVKAGVTDIEEAVREVIRVINQGAALNGRSNARRGAEQHPVALSTTDPSNKQEKPVFAVSGSTHDPAPFWDDTAFTSFDRGSHMGYVRAHLGRVVEDSDGNEGFSIVIHSTVPGATGRNFCIWLDNSRGQAPYRPQYLIGHGGRFRNFWCQPDEILGENMHPAPLPLSKHGRPFAPITTLRELLPPEESSDEFLNNLHLGYNDEVNSGYANANSEMPTGRSANTVYGESFEEQGTPSRYTEGLRVGGKARARINFGGLVASGVPGWAPDAGKWGFGADGRGGRFDDIYSSSGSSSYSAYVPTTDGKDENVGDSPLYGFRFEDHRGDTHTVRLLYRQHGKSFTTPNTTLPSSIENEVVIYFDDRDVSQGGFTLGKHMRGTGDPSGHIISSHVNTEQSWRGNEWRGVTAPESAYAVTVDPSGTTLSLKASSGVGYQNKGIWHRIPTTSGLDVLGYMGFPDSGLLWVTIPDGSDYTGTDGKSGVVLHYTSRTHNDSSGVHSFYGVTGGTLSTLFPAADTKGPTSTSDTKSPVLLSPMLNWTTLVTDELIAAAVEHALTHDPNSELESETAFDCSALYAPDGRTYGEWLGDSAKTAIRVKSFSEKSRVTPLSDLFEVTRSADWGLYEGSTTVAASTTTNNSHLGGLTRAEIDGGMRLDVGYLPKTVLHITTRYRGTNANTATPVLVDSSNNAVSVTSWQQHLRGELFTRFEGDHITPCIENPITIVDSASEVVTDRWEIEVEGNLHHHGPVGRINSWAQNDKSVSTGLEFGNSKDRSFVEKRNYWLDGETYLLARPVADATTHYVVFREAEATKGFSSLLSAGDILCRWSQIDRARHFDGLRLAGNPHGEPLTYFRGAGDSPDHSVPLYFGGGFSGVVMDVNDGTQNDYTEFYSHPYSSGPTGCSGLQNVGENMGAFAVLDTTAMLAMFPGTSLLNQHRGEANPPFTNSNAVLSPDLAAGSSAQTTGATYGNTPLTNPTPVVLRFAHPYARYTDSDNDVAYVIFGPGQSVPKHFKPDSASSAGNAVEPSTKWTVDDSKTHTGIRSSGGNTYLDSGTESGRHLPNELSNGDSTIGGADAFMPPALSHQQNNVYPLSVIRNWEPAYGAPNSEFNQTLAYDARLISGHFGSSKTTASLHTAHPFNHYEPSSGFSSANLYRILWHMDGGYSSGANWFDNAVRKNPPHPTTSSTISGERTTTVDSTTIRLGLNATMFRVGSLALADYDSNLTETGTARDVFVVDATRAQNSEELGAVIAAAINTWPGEGNLKALGGTFLPSFQDASRQDRYAWVKIGYLKAYGGGKVSATGDGEIHTLPTVGWVRLHKTAGSDGESHYGMYTSYDADVSSTIEFTLGDNYRSGSATLESPNAPGNGSVSSLTTQTHDVYVWMQTGNLRWSNGAPETLNTATPTNPLNSIYDHLAATQVHFSGIVDAIDRTRAVGAIGWHGERYSMLNSLKVTKTGGGTAVASGLGAWHPFLGFDPYGQTGGCHSLNGTQFKVTSDEASEGPTYTYTGVAGAGGPCPTGVHPRHYVVVSYEGELPIVAKADRDGIILAGDMLGKRWDSAGAGTVITSHSSRHNNDRYVAWSNAGPHVDAQFLRGTAAPSSGTGEWASSGATANTLFPADTCLFPTGDLFFDADMNPGVGRYPDDALFDSEEGVVSCTSDSTVVTAASSPFSYWSTRSAARNFLSQHIVWKRMGGGNLSMPAPNARGLGAIPWVWRKADDSNYYKFGENIYGNTRFSFETTNSVMFPTVQAQELTHPHLAEQFPYEIRNALRIPNEEAQFLALTVIDDTGQGHTLEGGSPLGTVVRDFSLVADRDVDGLAPALAGSGNDPNLKISLPHPDTVPGNIVVRSGFDRLQGYQHETMGTGGLQRPSLPDTVVKDNFNSSNLAPSTAPFWENEGWERIDERPDYFPDSRTGDLSSDNPISTSYEPHDRALYFHVTKMGWGYTEREPLGYDGNTLKLNRLTLSSYTTSTLTVNETVNTNIWKHESIPDGRYFLTVNGHIVSYTNVSGSTFTGCVFSPGFSASSGDSLKPSFYVPAGSTRHFAARRLRDHAEVSGESPDKKPIDWAGVATGDSPATKIRSDGLTPLPLPRMGHHYVTPTMAMLPGHLAHPLYQRLYTLHHACNSARHESVEDLIGKSLVVTSGSDGSPSPDTTMKDKEGVGPHALMWFSSTTASYPPSDIHGDSFTLMVETKIRYDGYGIADSTATCNEKGGHRIRLESGTNYSTHWNFPDPLEVGAYQIVIQPNLFAQQLMGNSKNSDFTDNTTLKDVTSGNLHTLLTDQQIGTVVALEWDSTVQSFDFILADAINADVRGCEIYLNEVMLDIDPSPGQQFTALPPLALNNPFGVNESSSGSLTRRSLPYRPNMFRKATPGYTLTVPWWSPALKSSTVYRSPHNWRKAEHYLPDDYYMFCRSTFGSVGSQITLAGYPTYYLDPYLRTYSSLSPTCIYKRTVTSEGTPGSSQDGEIAVDNNSLFPIVGRDYFNHKLELTDKTGRTHTATYSSRGYSSGTTNNTTRFQGVSGSSAFWSALYDGVILRLTGAYGTLKSSEIYTESDRSVVTRNLSQTLSGTRDTNSLHLPDAYLCLWHYNLGRPMTYYSDSRSSSSAAALDKKPYNHVPEFFETIHYHDFGYVVSDGPLDFRAQHWSAAGGTLVDPESVTDPMARDDSQSTPKKYHFGSFWPGGSRFGAHMSSLEMWGYAGPGWGKYWDDLSIYYDTSSGSDGTQLGTRDASGISETISGTSTKRNAGFGYRFCVRQPSNRPRWSIWSTQALLDPYVHTHSGYTAGPFVQSDSVSTNVFTETSSALNTTSESISTSYTGIIERITNASALVGSDLKGQQVRYSHGRRVTRPYGCAVRNIVNEPTALRLHQGDTVAGTGADTNVEEQRRNLALSLAHYVIDWWGNTTGEEVRRFPVRGFGIRPSWDPEDAYRATDRTKTPHTFASPGSHAKSRNDYDLFDPATAKRVGDRGDGRGVRWPTAFNEDVLQDVSTISDASGLLLSYHTSEPPIGNGFVRARNDDLQNDEVSRGISRRLEVSADDGLLKPEAMAGANIERAKNSLLPADETLQEPISRVAPRIGLDSMTVSEFNSELPKEHVAVATEAHSLHSDRGIGRRYIVAAGVKTNNKVVADFDLSSLNFSTYKQVMRLNMAHGLWPLGGNLILDLQNYMEPVSDAKWGRSNPGQTNSARTSNPYQTNKYDPLSGGGTRTNSSDKLIRFLVRPVRVLDHRHVEVFRDKTDALAGTSGGRYGVFTYSTPGARASSDYFMRGSNPAPDNPPYPPAYLFSTSDYAAPASVGPVIPGSEVSGFSNSLKQTVARITVASNTLQHFRGDSSRNGDYSVQPRYTQSLYPGSSQNTSTHTGESSHSDNKVDGV